MTICSAKTYTIDCVRNALCLHLFFLFSFSFFFFLFYFNYSLLFRPFFLLSRSFLPVVLCSFLLLLLLSVVGVGVWGCVSGGLFVCLFVCLFVFLLVVRSPPVMTVFRAWCFTISNKNNHQKASHEHSNRRPESPAVTVAGMRVNTRCMLNSTERCMDRN